MSIHPPVGIPPRTAEDISSTPDELRLFARIEGLAGEEAALLAIPHEKRRRDQHERLREISGELDRIWEILRERAHRVGHDGGRREGGTSRQ